jgi:hypothetical protein
VFSAVVALKGITALPFIFLLKRIGFIWGFIFIDLLKILRLGLNNLIIIQIKHFAKLLDFTTIMISLAAIMNVLSNVNNLTLESIK